MRAHEAILTMIRTAMVLTVVAVLAFGALATSLSAGTYDHHSGVMVDDHALDVGYQASSCASEDVSGDHSVSDGACCVGMCNTILTVAVPIDVPERLLVLASPAFRSLTARPSRVEFIRPPSLTI